MPRPDNDQTSIRKLSMVGKKSYSVSLPVDVIRVLKWQKGDVLFVRRQGNQVVIDKIEKEQ